jgi:transposase
MKENQDIRKAARIADVPLYAVAKKLEISEPTIYRWLRFLLPGDKEQRILQAIDELKKGESYV